MPFTIATADITGLTWRVQNVYGYDSAFVSQTHTHTLESIYLYVCMLSSAAESNTLWLSLFLVAMVITMSSPSLDFGFVDAFGANKRVLSSKADDFICI